MKPFDDTTPAAIGASRLRRCLALALVAAQVAAPGLLGAGRAVAASAIATTPAAAPTVEANREWLRGAYGARHPAVASFKGIPFAAPPVGALRWQAPQPHAPRAGVQEARDFSAACFQGNHNVDWYRRVARGFGFGDAPLANPLFSEDCLYLNVWTPALQARAALPVMVWIYGGSNKGGWSFEPNYDGENLAARGRVVVVTIAYRVGVFGFFGHPELRGTAAPTNFGLLDQVAALRWVRRNIARFGGDPDNITVFGQSAGATDIAYLITSPLARGLFRRAIAESGGSQMIAQGDLAESEQVGLDLTNALPGHPDLAAMRARSSAEIFAAADTALRTHNWRPVIDGRAVLMAPAVFYRRHGVPFDLLTGSTDNESYMYVDGDPASLAADLQQYSPAPRAILAALAAQHADVHRGHDRAMTLVHFGCPPYLMAAGAARNGRRSWVYRFTRVRPGPGGEQMLAYHGAEIPYVFDTHDSWLSGDEADTALTTAMVAYWSNFARNGDPNGPGLAPWPAYDGARARVLELGTRIGATVAHDAALCDRLAGDVYPGWAN